MQDTQTIDQNTTISAEYKENTKVKIQFFNTKHGALKNSYYTVDGRILDLSPELEGKKVRLILFTSSNDVTGLSVETSLIKGSDIRFGRGRLYAGKTITLKVGINGVFYKEFPILYTNDTASVNVIEIPV